MKLFAAAAKTAFVSAALVLAAGAAHAEDFTPAKAGQWKVDVRLTDVTSAADDAILTGAGASTGLHVKVKNDIKPTLGFTYMLTDNLSIEAIAGVTNHEIKAEGVGTDVAVHKTWVLPPVVTLQYRPLPAARFSPYVGAGINYMLFFGGKDKNGFNVKLDNGFGYALQAGADIAVQGPWVINVDAKKVWFKTDANINNGALKSAVHLDPWVVSVGVSRRF
jgi:outer membrane protein